jgi:hypothetical protein
MGLDRWCAIPTPASTGIVLTLGYSRKSVWLLVFRSSARIWAELHEKALRRLGGTTRLVVLDNLREGVLSPDIYDPCLNPLYRDVLAHYGVTALPCKVRDPDPIDPRRELLQRVSAGPCAKKHRCFGCLHFLPAPWGLVRHGCRLLASARDATRRSAVFVANGRFRRNNTIHHYSGVTA